MPFPRSRWGRVLGSCSVVLWGVACSGSEPGGAQGLAGGTGGTGNTSGSAAAGQRAVTGGSSSTSSGGTGALGGGPTILLGGSGGSGTGGDAGAGELCASVAATATLEPVYLAFAFDVSGSMGKGDYPWHDATLKWEPVVAATRGFFEDPASAGLLAQLTAFPIDADDDERCDEQSYTEPDVSMTELPSTKFGEALDAIRAEDWRGGTPTLAVVGGVLRSVDAYRAAHPGHYALVLVTDGYPQGCDDDSIEAVEDAVRAAAADVPTYVIGVKNPPLEDDEGNAAPDTVSNLTGVAEAGGTETAFIIDTGDPAKTSADFATAVEKIRGVAVACNLVVPKPPDGRTFEKDHVTVSTGSGADETPLTYDASCATDGAWHYDDLDKPTEVVLCPATCARVQADSKAELHVGFTCQPVIQLPR